MKRDFSNTTFIIGAGAHVPYGFPTAMGLTEFLKSLYRDGKTVTSISNKPSPSHSEIDKDRIRICWIIQRLELVSPPEKPGSKNAYDIKIGEALDRFLKEFGESQVYSIDAFLANYINRPTSSQDLNFSPIGKLLIAFSVLKFESSVPVGFHDFDWIQHLINNFLKDQDTLESFLSNPPKIFTFNYDRHFEKCLVAHLKAHHGMDHEDAVSRIDGLDIVHFYGMVDSLRKQGQVETIKTAIDNMCVVGEERFGSEIEQRASKVADAIQSTKEIYFLGFGFDELNIELLFRKCDLKDEQAPHVYSTNIGLTPFDIERISEAVPVKIKFFDREVDCQGLISRHRPIFRG